MTAPGNPSTSLGFDQLVGRADELAELIDSLDRVMSGASTVGLVEVTGDAGIGKTALLTEFGTIAGQRGATVLSGRAAPATPAGAGQAGSGRPYALVADAVAEHYQQVRAAVAAADPTWRGELAAITGIERSARIEPHSPDAGQQAVRFLLEQLATRPLVLLLDDLHRADDASLELLAGLLRRPVAVPTLIVLGYRHRQAGGRLLAALRDRAKQVTSTVLALGPLAEADVEQLLGGQGMASWRQRLYRDSAGNPAYLRALLAEQPSFSAYLDLTRTEHGARSGDYAVFSAELDGLGPATRAVAEAGAVLGDEFEAEAVATILAEPLTSTLDAIGALIRRDVLRPSVRDQCFGFRHPVVRRAIYQATGLSTRIELHTGADRVLLARNASALERAPHVVQRARHGDLAAVEVLRIASRSATLTSPNTAADWLRTALRILPNEPAHLETRGLLLVWLAKARGGSGYLRECRDLLHEALDLLPARSTPLYRRVLAFTAMVQRLLGTYDEADALLRAEIELLDPEDTSETAGLLKIEMAAVELANGDLDTAFRSATDALRIAGQDDRPALSVAADGLRAMARAAAGDITASARCLDSATRVLDAMLDAQFARNTDTVVWIGWTDMLLERWDDALRHFDKAVDFATRGGHRLGLPHLLIGQMSALRNRGRLRDMAATVEHAVYLAAESGSPEQLISAYAMRSWLATMLDRPADALASDRIVTAHARDSANGWCETLALRMLAEARLLNGNYDGCLTLATTVGGPDLLSGDAWSRVAWYELLARAELAAGRVDAAAKWAESADADAAMLVQPGRGALAQLAKAQVLLACQPELALDPAQEAVLGLERSGMVMDALRAKVVLGNALWHHDRHDEAVGELRSAQSAFEQINAVSLARHARTERRRLTARTPRGYANDASSSSASLTRREQQVADMVRQGLTNRLIAKQLHIAEKTVEMHLSNVFAKLDVYSRAAVAALISGQDQGFAGSGARRAGRPQAR